MRTAEVVAGILISALLVCVGCQPSLGVDVATVKGTVTMDGDPLPDATVTFQPEEGRASIGITDASGQYELTYSRDAMGAMVGQHTVTITTRKEGDPEAGIEPVAEIVPAKYNAQTELTRDVTAGNNTIDFELNSDGEIEVQAESSGEE